MDLLPVNPVSTNKVDSSLNLANDGGSKSNSGYFNQRDSEEKKQEKIDEVNFSHAHDSEEADEPEINWNDLSFIGKIQSFLVKIKEFVLKFLGLKKEEIPNIYERHSE